MTNEHKSSERAGLGFLEARSGGSPMSTYNVDYDGGCEHRYYAGSHICRLCGADNDAEYCSGENHTGTCHHFDVPTGPTTDYRGEEPINGLVAHSHQLSDGERLTHVHHHGYNAHQHTMPEGSIDEHSYLVDFGGAR